jgi:UDP-N-acetylglucosamine 3-dehydrogenase
VCLLDLVIHDFDYLRWTLGEVERVYARGMLGREYNRLDYVLATLRFESGTIAHVEGHWGYPGPFNYSIEVAGSNALLTVDSTEPDSLQLISGASEEVPDLASGKSPYAKELEHFIHCIATGEEPIVQSQDACEALRIGLAATESVLTGEPVTLGGRE